MLSCGEVTRALHRWVPPVLNVRCWCHCPTPQVSNGLSAGVNLAILFGICLGTRALAFLFIRWPVADGALPQAVSAVQLEPTTCTTLYAVIRRQLLRVFLMQTWVQFYVRSNLLNQSAARSGRATAKRHGERRRQR